ncbi:mucin-2-like isoform X2 [Daphnia pulicaria]|uniref:mucin-2-like isoform X2 n=1 Tax=Daphnia pulicaria TaxID=35523 RepID=UPI001EEADD55|nr:mucin-2-like isoform X2 [Daphnia pulicaria]
MVALAKMEKILLVLVVCTTAIFGQNDMYSTEAKHRSIGNRPPPFAFYSPHPPTYGVPPPQRVPPYQTKYPVSRPTYVAPPSYPVRPSHSPPAYRNAHQTAHRVPAYQIPYPAAASSRPMTTYAAPAPQKPIYSTPVTPRPPVYSPPANPPHHSTFNYMGHQAHRVPAPPTTPTPAKVPFTYPSTTPKPYAYSAPSAPVTGPSLLDLPWVKPLYARSPSPPATEKYSWNVQQVRPAVAVVRDDSEEDVGVFISSVNTPVSVPAATPVRSQNFEVRGIPQETRAPVAIPAPTQMPVIIQDDSDEDIQIVQEVTRRTPLPSSPLIIRDESQVARFAPMPTQAPFVPAVIRADDSRQQMQNPAAQRAPSVPLPTTTQVQNVRVIVRDDSVEDIQIAQQQRVIPSAPRATQPSVNPIIIRDDSIEDIQVVQRVIPSPPRVPQLSVNPIVIRDDSVEDIRFAQQVIPSAPRAPQPSVNPIIIRDDSVENIQIAQQVIPSPPRATQPSVNPIIIRDDSNEDIQIVQQVFTSTPSPRTTATPANLFIIRDDSVEDVQLIQQVPTFTPSPLTAAAPVNPIVIRDDSIEDRQVIQLGQQFQTTAPLGGTLPRANPIIVQDDSIEDFQIVQRIQQVATITPSPLATQTPRIPVVIRDDSIEDDDDRIVRLNLPAPNNNVIASPRPSEIPFVRLDNSDEFLFRDVPIGVQPVPNAPVLASVPTATQAPGTQNLFFRDSDEDFRILQNAPGSPILRTATQDNSLEVRSNLSNEDIELRLLSQGVTASNINLSGPLPTTPAPRRVVLVDSVEDTRRNPGVPISNVQLSGSADVFLVNSNEDLRIAQQFPQPNVSLSGPLPGNSTPPRFILVDSTEDIQAAQQVSLSNVSPSGSSPANAPSVILIESAEENQQAQNVNPLLQSANVVLRQDSLEVPDRSDEVRIPTTVTISQVSTNLAN